MGRVALVTGAAGDLGSAIARVLAELGAAVAVVDIDERKLTEVADDLVRVFGAPAVALQVDLREADAVRALPDRAVRELGGLNIVVNCAALVGTAQTPGWSVPFAEQRIEPWQQALAINLTAPFLLAQASAPHLRGSAGASIINIASIYGVSGPDWRLYDGTSLGNPAAYAASKGGLLQLTRWLATTLAPEIRVNAVSPGGIERGQAGAFVERYVDRTPLRRMAREDDVVGAVAFLATDLSSYVTGQNILVDGGWTAW